MKKVLIPWDEIKDVKAKRCGFTYEDKFKDLENNLSVAKGALQEVAMMVTSGVDKRADDKIQELAKGILERILMTNLIRTKPMWYRFDWEEKLYNTYID